MKRLGLLVFVTSSLCASYIIEDPNYNPYALAGSVAPPLEDIYRRVVEAYQAQDWETVKKEGQCLLRYYPQSPFVDDVYFYMGTSLYKLRTFDKSDIFISKYLTTEGVSKHFEEAMLIKYKIARSYQNGKLKPCFGFRPLPNLLGAKEDALGIYDEIIALMPRHDLAAESLYYKGRLLLSGKNYKDSIESFQTLIRRFPKNSLAVDGYISIFDVYLTRAKKEYADPDLLDLALLNQRQFEQHFPTEGRLEEGEVKIQELQEVLARDLMKVANFYKKSKKTDAIKLYYSAIVERYPDTLCAQEAKQLLLTL
ncbi:MAG: outer membrane protein assembly factor BamD [Simkaniaceae bacterium]|nr:outer membrane protein assembly factor BamD [Simkaniaceae bacterium]